MHEECMKRNTFAGGVAAALGVILTGTLVRSQSKPPTEGPAVGETPAWFLQGSFPDPGGRTIVDPGGHVTVPPRSGSGGPGAAPGGTPPCRRSPVCGNRLGRARQTLQ